MSGCNAAVVNSSDVRFTTSAAKPIRHGYSVSRLDSRRLVHLCTIPAPVGPATSFSSRSFPHQRNYIGSYVFCVDEVTTWRPNDHCGHWFRQTWLLKSFNTIDAMVAKLVRVLTMKVCKTLYRGLGDGCTGDHFFCHMSIPKSNACCEMPLTHVSSRLLDTQQLSGCLSGGSNGPKLDPL